ncbi:FAD-binding oxidoreductase [Streptomyces solicathayae]|uniref:FAD-binding oxidoreductase n=1 Tax=Streptomyces solicathayae TaxID=3081768 RepID=A0ABZ0LW87_9ACTN|nr:FAD-binding oxidoreductase [Streptomyces sp. HUAS YS2]WOX23770.1 FAD-binding oxidoreductase [Streptomyces sp. HUAS YS2]
MDGTALDTLREALRGEVIGPQDEGYDEARSIYNAMVDKRPAAIVRAADTTDVRATVRFARDTGVEFGVQGGGHSGAGLGLIDGGLTLDLSGGLRWVHVDPASRTARVGGGAQLGDLDHEAHGFGLATPAGIMSTTGVGGLTLGGGHGHLTRAYGLTVDNLLAADVVLSDGSFVTASQEEHPELFWALRGGGGNFGVVTSFTFRMHPVDTVGLGVTVWLPEQMSEVARWYREFLPAAPRDLNGFLATLVVPPEPPFPEELHGRKVFGVVWCYTGENPDEDRLTDVFAEVNEPAPPAFHFATPIPYPALQSLNDHLIPKGLQWYWRGDFFDRITDESIDVHAAYLDSMPTELSLMHLYPVDGAARDVGPDDTAWAYRDAVWSGVIAGISPYPGQADTIRQWCVDYWDALHTQSMGGSYVNFIGADEGQERVRATYRGHYDRLAGIKREYDPDNFFRNTQDILPAA